MGSSSCTAGDFLSERLRWRAPTRAASASVDDSLLENKNNETSESEKLWRIYDNCETGFSKICFNEISIWLRRSLRVKIEDMTFYKGAEF